MENFSTFCQQTSLHGWQYIAQKQVRLQMKIENNFQQLETLFIKAISEVQLALSNKVHNI